MLAFLKQLPEEEWHHMGEYAPATVAPFPRHHPHPPDRPPTLRLFTYGRASGAYTFSEEAGAHQMSMAVCSSVMSGARALALRRLGHAAGAVAITLLLMACRDGAPGANSAGTAAPTAGASAAASSSASSPAAAKGDPYDASKMDFKTPPAVLSTERHTGAFAAGSSLSPEYGAALKPLDPSPVKEIRLDTTHKIIEIAPGVKFAAWTFGNQVPGPVVRVRVGDRIKFSMTNRSDEPAPGVQFTTAPMMHSMDFHAAMVAPNDKYRSIAPGQTISFEFTPNYPGVFMYHCGTPMVLEHIASGMYGMVIVEPRDGYPTKVDREYAVVQSEFYTKPDPARNARSTASRCTCSTASGCARRRRPTRCSTAATTAWSRSRSKPSPASACACSC